MAQKNCTKKVSRNEYYWQNAKIKNLQFILFGSDRKVDDHNRTEVKKKNQENLQTTGS